MINEIVVNKALRAEIPAFGSYMVEAADQDGFEYERSLTAANGMTFDAILAKLPARLRLVDSNDQIGVYNGTWVCESYTKGDAGETREGDYHFRFVVEEGVENAPVDLYGVTDIVVTVAGVADVGDLQAAIAAAEAKTQTDYTASSYAAMTAVLTEAKALADRDVKSQAEVDAMEEKLTAAVQALIEKGDVTALKALCESLAGKKETDYTVSSWKPFAEAMAAAKALVDDPDDAGKEAIAAAKAKLEEAKLAARGDVAALKGAYEANQRELGVDSADRRYTRQTWTDYLAAMADALAVVTDNERFRPDGGRRAPLRAERKQGRARRAGGYGRICGSRRAVPRGGKAIFQSQLGRLRPCSQGYRERAQRGRPLAGGTGQSDRGV